MPSLWSPKGHFLDRFSISFLDLEKIAAKHGLSVQMYADDTQIYTSFTSENVCQTKLKIENCLSEINNWMCQNYLKNKSK